jgi:hypothetical protein
VGDSDQPQRATPSGHEVVPKNIDLQ